MKQITYMAPGAIETVRSLLDDRVAHSVFVVADRTAYDKSGARMYLKSALQGRVHAIFDDFAPNPKYADVMRGIKFWHAHPCDIMIAIGGGSAIDMAKLIGICGTHRGQYRELLMGEIPIRDKAAPLIAIPTTAGTGSEATHFAVVYVGGQKYSVVHANVLPDYAIIDPNLTANLPPSITAHTGLDALSQAVESLWSVNATAQSRVFASEALRLVLDNLEAAVHRPTLDVRANMCRAAHLSGKAINISKTTAPHAISYTLTSQFGVPHGLAVALTLGAVLIYNNGVTSGDCWHPKGVAQVQNDIRGINRLIGVESSEEARKHIDDLISTIGCPTRLRQIGVDTAADLETIVQNVNTERLKNNPRALSQFELRRILREIR